MDSKDEKTQIKEKDEKTQIKEDLNVIFSAAKEVFKKTEKKGLSREFLEETSKNPDKMMKLWNEKLATDEEFVEMACLGGHINILEQVKAKGISFKQFGILLGRCACSGGQVEVLDWLKANNIPVGMCNCCGSIIYACHGGHIPVLEWYIRQGGTPTCRWANAACAAGKINVLEWLHQRGIHEAMFGEQWAREYGHTDVLEWLKQHPSSSVKPVESSPQQGTIMMATSAENARPISEKDFKSYFGSSFEQIANAAFPKTS